MITPIRWWWWYRITVPSALLITSPLEQAIIATQWLSLSLFLIRLRGSLSWWYLASRLAFEEMILSGMTTVHCASALILVRICGL